LCYATLGYLALVGLIAEGHSPAVKKAIYTVAAALPAGAAVYNFYPWSSSTPEKKSEKAK
jgi:hypothetical protein